VTFIQLVAGYPCVVADHHFVAKSRFELAQDGDYFLIAGVVMPADVT
jgi:hypothetical protein